MTWGVLGAVEEEVWAVIDNMTQRKESRWNKKSIYQGKIKNRDVVVMSTGVGKVATAAAVQFLIDHFPVDCIIFTGVAGAINPELKVGDIVVCQKAVQHDFDIGGKRVFENMKTPWFETEPRLVQMAIQVGQMLKLGERIKTGIVLTGDQTIINSQQKEWLWQTFQGDCVEMEGASVALVCSLNEIPFLLIRAITDHADEHAREDFRSSMSKAAIDSATIVLGMLDKYGEIKVLKRNLVFRAKKFLLRKIKSAKR
jgi:5'-methylthioadenosine/S-adenosylhomocysteine nucleosidase